MHESFEGVVLGDDTIKYKKDGGPVACARATVDTDGEVVRRFTATRLVLMVRSHWPSGRRRTSAAST